MSVIGAVMRKLIHIAYGLLKSANHSIMHNLLDYQHSISALAHSTYLGQKSVSEIIGKNATGGNLHKRLTPRSSGSPTTLISAVLVWAILLLTSA